MTKKEKPVVMAASGTVLSVAHQLDYYIKDYDLSTNSELCGLVQDLKDVAEELRNLIK